MDQNVEKKILIRVYFLTGNEGASLLEYSDWKKWACFPKLLKK